VLAHLGNLFLAQEASHKVAVRDLTISLPWEAVADLDIMTTTQQMAALVAVAAGILVPAVVGLEERDPIVEVTLLIDRIKEVVFRAKVLVEDSEQAVIQAAQAAKVVPE
jgi:hypothetical protein